LLSIILTKHKFEPLRMNARAEGEESHNGRRVTVEPRRRQHMLHRQLYAIAWHRRCTIQYIGPKRPKEEGRLAVSITKIAG
jgi:hypothetical protein